MPLQILRHDITKIPCDAIVNAANPTLLGGGGVDGAIHRAAGPGLLTECRKLGGCKTGQAKITRGYNLPCHYVIHTVGPRWRGGGAGEKELLACCYRAALELAAKHQCETVAFPLISTGAYGYPKEEALEVAVSVVRDFLSEQEMQVILAVYDKESFQIGQERMGDIAAYIDERYIEERPAECSRALKLEETARFPLPEAALAPSPEDEGLQDICVLLASSSLRERMQRLDESFSQMLLRKIDEKGMTDPACYKKANVDRKLFCKIRGDANYRPSKPTALAFAVALELSLEETEELLRKAGFALSHSSKFDLILEYFIERQNYNIFEINEALFAFDQPLLGM